MSIYRRYVSEFTLRRLDDGKEIVMGPHHTTPDGIHRHPIYITIPDEDAPGPPEIPDVPHRTTRGRDVVTIISPPVMDPTRDWIVLIRWDGGEVTTYDLDKLTRTVREYGPDGNSVARHEVIEVEVTWPDGRPDSSVKGYTVHGSWCFAEGADHA